MQICLARILTQARVLSVFKSLGAEPTSKLSAPRQGSGAHASATHTNSPKATITTEAC